LGLDLEFDAEPAAFEQAIVFVNIVSARDLETCEPQAVRAFAQIFRRQLLKQSLLGPSLSTTFAKNSPQPAILVSHFLRGG